MNDTLSASPVGVPNRFLFLWSGRTFPYFCRLAVESVLLADADAEVRIMLFGETPAEAPHFRALSRYRRVEVAPVDGDDIFSGLGEPPFRYREHLAAVPPSSYRASARSNIYRYALLHRYGGIYVDFDILVIRSFRDLLDAPAFIGQEYVWKADEDRVAGRIGLSMAVPTLAYLWTYAVRRLDSRIFRGRRRLEPLAAVLDGWWSTPNLNPAVFGAAAGSSFVRRVLAASLEADPAVRYNLGPTLVSRVARESGEGVRVLPPEYFHLNPPSYSFRYFEESLAEPSPETRLFHYVSSNNRGDLADLDPDTILARRTRGLFYRYGAAVAEGARDLPLKGAPA
jgi:hypothetical protein